LRRAAFRDERGLPLVPDVGVAAPASADAPTAPTAAADCLKKSRLPIADAGTVVLLFAAKSSPPMDRDLMLDGSARLQATPTVGGT
jgi:hypothetical protein